MIQRDIRRIRLAKLLKKVNLSENEKNLMDEVNRFNIRTRYPDYRLKFYKLCTASYTEDYLKKIKKLFNKLCREIKLKK